MNDRMVHDAYESALPRMVAGVALIWQFTILIQVLACLRDYRRPLIPLAAWAAMLGAAGWLAPRARRDGLDRADAAFAVATAVAVVALVGWQRRSGADGSVDWSIAGTCWLLAIVAVFRPPWEWATGALLVYATHAVFAVHALGMTALGQTRLAVAGYVLAVVLAVFAALRPALRTQARIAARHSTLASQAAAQRAKAAVIQQDRQDRLRLLEAEARPLLRGIADGRLDPADSGVRSRCERCAATLRQVLVDKPREPQGLLADLKPTISAAMTRGTPVTVQVIGDPGSPDRGVVDATQAAIDGLVSVLPPHPVTLTILASGKDVELYLAFHRRPRGSLDMASLQRLPSAEAGWRATVDVDENGAGCLEVRWRNSPP